MRTNCFLFRHFASEKTEAFLHSFAFLSYQALFFFVSWMLSSLLFSLFGVLFSVVMIYLFSDDGNLFAPLAFFYMLSFSKFPDYGNLPYELFLALGIYVFSIFLFILKRIYLHIPFQNNLGSLGFSFLFILVTIGISYTISFLNSDSIYMDYGLNYFLYLVLYVFVYLLLNSIGTKGYGDTLKKIFVIFDLLILLEIIFISFKNSQITYDIGWGSKNTIAITLECCLPFLALSEKKKTFSFQKLLFIFLILITYVFIIMSNSRGGIITTLILTPFLAYLLAYPVEWKKRILLTLGFTLLFGLSIFLFYSNIPEVKEAMDLLFSRGNDISGRDKIWFHALDYFYHQPLFGGGPVSLFEINDRAFGSSIRTEVMLCHNTFYTMLALSGLSGVLGYIFFNLQAIFAATFHKNEMRFALYCFIFLGFVHGLIDNTFLSPTYMFPVLIVFCFAEQPDIENFLQKFQKKRS